jgi:hypothetical protein
MSTRPSLWNVRTGTFILVVATVYGAGALAAKGADAPSLDEIKTRLRQKREAIKSLYVETNAEWQSPLSVEEMRKLPNQWTFGGSRKEGQHFAFQGDKRYSRTLRPWAKMGSPPKPVEPPPPPPNAGPIQKEAYRQQKEMYEKMKAMSVGAPQVVMTAQDLIEVFNGKELWGRNATSTKGPDGKETENPAIVGADTPKNVSARIPPPAYLGNVGLAICGPDIATADPALQEMCYSNLLPELLEGWPYSVSGTEQVDGTPCVVLTGTRDRKVTVGQVTQGFKIHDKLWLDLQRGLALRKREWTTTLGKEVYRVVNTGFEELAPGLWLPKESESQSIAPADGAEYPEQVRGRPYLVQKCTLLKWSVNDVGDELFESPAKPGDLVLASGGPVHGLMPMPGQRRAPLPDQPKPASSLRRWLVWGCALILLLALPLLLLLRRRRGDQEQQRRSPPLA